MKDYFKVLIAEDVKSNRMLLKHILEKNNFLVEEASEGYEALEKLKNDLCDIALLDIDMPGIDGFSICKKIREHRSAQELPILFITAKTQDCNLAEGFAIGGNDYITKPINKTILLARLNAQVQLLHTNRALSRTYTQLANKKRMESIGVFAAAIAHNFNNILSTVLGSSELIQVSSEASSTIHKSAKLIAASANRGAKLVKSLLTFANPSEQSICEHPEEIIKSTFALMPSIGHSGISLKLAVDEALPTLAMSPSDLSQVLIEVIRNSIEAIKDKGEIVLEVTAPEVQKSGHVVTFTLQDTGCGIPQDLLEHIFEPFYSSKNLDRMTGIALDGSGLGLTSVHNILKHVNGSIEVLKSDLSGTTLEIKIPTIR